MAGGASANPSNLSRTPVGTQGATTSAYTPRLTTLPTAPVTAAPSSTYSVPMAARQGFAQPGAVFQPSATRMPAQVTGYGNFPQAPTSVNRGPSADQVRAQMLAYQQQYQPGMQRAQAEVQQYDARMRQAEADRKAEIARQAAAAEAARQAAAAAEAERLRQEQEAASSWSGSSNEGWYTGATGGLASLQGFDK